MLFSYERYGDGPRHLLAFPGYEQPPAVFRRFAEADGSLSVFAFDPHFGQQLSDPTRFSPQDWKMRLEEVLQSERIERFYLAGFSIGGRAVFATLHAFAERVEGVTLVAPDGLRRNGWYEFAVNTALGRWLFRKLMSADPQRLFKFMRWLADRKLLADGVVRLAEGHLDRPERRELLLKTWLSYRQLPTLWRPKGALPRRLSETGLRLTVYLGEHDPIFPPAAMRKALRSVSHETTVLNDGHTYLLQAVNRHCQRIGVPFI